MRDKTNKKWGKIALASLLIAGPTSLVMADGTNDRIRELEDLAAKVRLSGYLNLTAGIAKEESGFFDYSNKLETTPETWGGIQMDFKASNKLKATLLTKFYAEEKPYDNAFGVDLAYLTYRVAPRTQIRAGILRVPLYKDSDYKDTGFAHLWLRTPQLIYQNDKVQRHTGIDIIQDFDIGDGILQLQAFYGQNEDPRAGEKCNCTKTLMIDDIMGLKANYSIDEHTFSLATMTRTEPGKFEDFVKDDKVTGPAWLADERQTFYTMGYGYDNGEWKIDAESIIQLHNSPISNDLGKFYISAGRRFGDFTPYAVFSYVKSLDSTNDEEVIATHERPNGDVMTAYMPQGKKFRMLSLGARYDINSSMAFKAQIDEYDSESIAGRKARDGSFRKSELDNRLYSISLQMVF